MGIDEVKDHRSKAEGAKHGRRVTDYVKQGASVTCPDCLTEFKTFAPTSAKEYAKNPWDSLTGYCCATCRHAVPGANIPNEGRCRRNAPTMDGYPVVMLDSDFCGQHKIGTNPLKEAAREDSRPSLVPQPAYADKDGGMQPLGPCTCDAGAESSGE